MPRFSHVETILGSTTYEKISNCRVLMVGAGGIGCELLKNLVMSGFKQIELVDLDIIDLSNLNRQFLFQKQHIKKSKAQVARESALKFNPNVNIIAHRANIKDLQFNVEWFKSFDIVMNALDNLDARRHVNMMCLAADVPLVESGSEGYLGQVTVIKKGKSECYECQPKPTQKTYPVCTIRSTPSIPIHCIVWAKNYLFGQLFGIPEDDEGLGQEVTEENAEEIANLKRETLELKNIREAMGSQDYTKIVFQKVFKEDIDRLLMMEDMWKTRKPPVPLIYDDIEKLRDETESQSSTAEDNHTLKDQRSWNLAENFTVFLDSVRRLSTRLLNEKKTNPNASLIFDKDDADALDFVTATSNLRARVFGIEEKTKFQVKAMAGNIIPAIATTNAIVAGLIVMQAFKVLNEKINECKTVYCAPERRPSPILSESLMKPNPDCPICQNTHVTLKVNTKKVTLREFIEKVVQSQDEGGMDICEASVEEGGRIIYDVDYVDNLDATFEQLKITDGKMMKVTPDDDGMKCPAIFAISHKETFERPGTWFYVDGNPRKLIKHKHVEENFTSNSSQPSKRKRDDLEIDSQETSQPPKRLAINEKVVVKDDDIIMTDEGAQELIVLD
ncbi:537_t:CDS:10 [Acaulospora morrowiae]|uniref:Ubiquitin-activating enzyme E1-like n=1 Tax=Acaulospora morrowiae TaxID=94023 RepID=A0A9N9ANT8_9GLOM|nr:537_t:CDS:10 [Acaulospora morrowiae]